MNIVKILTRVFSSILAVIILFLFFVMAAEVYGYSINFVYDFYSFLIVVVVPYFLISASSGSFIFFIKKKYLKAYGDLAFSFGFIGFVIGAILSFS